MFFYVSKVVWYVVEPINFLLLIGLIGILLGFGRFAGVGRPMMAGAIIALAIAAFSPLGGLMLRALEDRFPLPSADMPAPTGIIVLGGSLDESISLARKSPALLAAASRLTGALVLAKRYPQARLIFTGGNASLRSTDLSEADGVRDFWLSLGLPPERMSFETTSKNTWENAINTRELVQPKPGETWLLVTSAWHMPRAMGIFRRAGFSVTAYPVDFRTFGDDRDWRLTYVVLDELTALDLALHEWIGLVAYHLTGKTGTWFPAP
ncbi:MAG: YdcF family protein [Beijerinckiaceae bacterium]